MANTRVHHRKKYNFRSNTLFSLCFLFSLPQTLDNLQGLSDISLIWPLEDGDRFSLWLMLNSSCEVAILLVQVKDARGRLLFLDLELVRHFQKFSCQSSG
ncbi:unnamed protein product [Arabidopsis halleri]